MSSRVTRFVLFLIVSLSSWAQASERPLLGTGIDVLTKEARNTWPIVVPIDSDDPIHPPVCSYQQSVDLQIARDVQSLKTIVGIDAAASLDIFIATATGRFGYEFDGDDVKNHVFVVFKAVARSCSYRMKEPVFATPDIASLYTEDYRRFRTKYGDRFVNVVTTGGSFIGIIAIDAGESHFKFSLETELKVEIGDWVFKLGWHEGFERILRKYKNVDVKVIVNGREAPTDSPRSMWNRYRDFTNTLLSADCQDEEGHLKCPYVSAKYESFDALTTLPDPSSAVRNAAEFIGQMQMRIEALDTLRHRIDRIRALAHLFHSTTSGGSVKEDTASAVRDIEELKRDLSDAVTQCRDAPFDVASCVDPMTSFETWMRDLDMNLPKKNYPQDCEEIRILNETYVSGKYTVYMNGEVTKPYEVFCERMDGDTPETYLALKQTSPASLHPRYNFSRYLVYPEPLTCDEIDLVEASEQSMSPTILSSTYDAVQVRPVGEDLLEVLPGQHLHRRQTGIGLEVTIDGVTYTPDNALFGRPMRFFSDGREYGEAFVGNIDLRFTPFVFDDTVSWVLTSESGTNNEVIPYEPTKPKRKTIDLVMPRGTGEKVWIAGVVGDGESRREALLLRYHRGPLMMTKAIRKER